MTAMTNLSHALFRHSAVAFTVAALLLATTVVLTSLAIAGNRKPSQCPSATHQGQVDLRANQGGTGAARIITAIVCIKG